MKKTLHTLIQALAPLCTFAILYLTLTPSKGTPIETISDITWGGEPGDAVLHCIIFILHTLLWLWALRGCYADTSARRYATGLGLLVGLGTETAQIFLPTRGAILMDYSANVLGVALGLLIYRIYLKKNS